MGGKDSKEYKVDGLGPDSPLIQAQQMKTTAFGIKINSVCTARIMTRAELRMIRRKKDVAEDVRIIMNKPFSEMSRITDSLYLTSVGGILVEHIHEYKIACIINATYEMPLANFPGVKSLRVPVDDDPEEQIFPYLDDVATVIHYVSKRKGRTVVHCMAGASRSSTLVIAYLIKYQEYTLKNAFCYLKSLRPCARPNIGFFEQLIKYESFYRKHNSVAMYSFKKDGKTISVPDFYKTEFPDLFKVEVQKQLNKSHLSKVRLQESNQNYINRNRGYGEVQKDIDKFRDDCKDNTESEQQDKK